MQKCRFSPINDAIGIKQCALSELVKYVIEDSGCSIEQAMEKVYHSPIAAALQDEEAELYVQSPAYLYELMNLHRDERLQTTDTAD